MTMTSTDPDLSRPDYAAIKTRQQAAWASGDYARIGVTLQIVGETLAEAMDLPAGASALDVAAGNGKRGRGSRVGVGRLPVFHVKRAAGVGWPLGRRSNQGGG